jgi:hypothetical protein
MRHSRHISAAFPENTSALEVSLQNESHSLWMPPQSLRG